MVIHLRHILPTFILIWLFALSTQTAAQEQALMSPAAKAIHFTTLDKINLSEVNKIIRTKQGYIWLATADGLIRYDGYNAKQYLSDPNDPNSLSHNTLMDVIEDADQNLWISTYGGGLNKFDTHTGLFEKVSHLLPNEISSQDTEKLYALQIDKQGSLWIGSRVGLYRVDIKQKKAIALPQAMQTLPKTLIDRLIIDQNDNYWISSYSDGAFYYDGKTLKNFVHDPADPTSISSNNVRNINLGPNGGVWLGTTQGLNKFIVDTHTFQRFRPSDNPSINSNADDISYISSDHKGNLWLGTMASGMMTFSLKSQTFELISGERDLYRQFASPRITSITRDIDNNIWIAASQGFILSTEKFRRFNYLSNNSGTMKVTDITPLSSGKLAIVGSYKLYEYDPINQTSHIRLNSLEQIYRVSEDQHNTLWLSNLGDGLIKFTAEQKLTHYPYDATPQSPVPNYNIIEAFIDNKQNIWLLPFYDTPHSTGGIFSFDQQTGQSKQWHTGSWFTDILQLDDNNLLMTTDDIGLMTLNTSSAELTQWRDNIPSTPLMAWSMLKDSANNLWVGTRGQGLAYFDKKANKFEFFTRSDGLLSNGVHSIVEDNDHNLWLNTSLGLTRFNPKTKQVLNLEPQDGLLYSAFRWHTSHKMADGTLMFGTTNGLLMFDPNDFKQQPDFPQIIINDFRRFNKSVPVSSQALPTPLEHTIEFTEQIELTHLDYEFSFHFSALEYDRPDKIQFAYKMLGLNEDWVYTDSNNRVASYTKLPGKEYTFMVKSTNANGVWNDQVTRIKVIIHPPWWLTWQAYITYVLLVLGSVYFYVRSKTAQFKAQAKLLENKVDERTKELSQSKSELEQSNQQLAQQSQAVSALLAQKQRLFASVSHEFRTPLTLILSPIDQLLASKKGLPINNELTLIRRSARRLLRMVDQLLEFAKLEQKTTHTTEQVSLAQTVNIITASFEALVATKQMTMSVLPFNDVALNLIPDSLNKILINIISNAFKYTPANGEITISVTRTNNNVDIAIKDNGKGICQSDSDAIFERFNRASHNDDESVSGAGIGLALVKELIEANKGQIALQSEVGNGSTFIVSLPVFSDEAPQPEIEQDNAALNERLELELDSMNNPNEPIEHQQLVNQDSNKKTILIIDDNADMRQLLDQQLTDDYQCLQAANGRSGLEIAQEQLPDMVISDVMMPIMDGYELAERLKSDELTSHIPIIMLTAKGSLESRVKGLELLVDDYLAKPFNVQELKLRIRNILTIREIIRKRFGQAIDSTEPKEQLKSLGISQVEQRFIDKVDLQMSQHFNDLEFNARALSQHLAISERQLQRKVRALLNVGLAELIRNYRLNKAVEQLNTGVRASQIYYEVGFSSHSYFSSCFKAKFGKTPSEYQKSR